MSTVSVVMFGARMHYAVPKILHGNGQLHGLYNDLNANFLFSSFRRYLANSTSGVVKRFSDRVVAGVPSDKIYCAPFTAAMLHIRRGSSKRFDHCVAAEIAASKRLSKMALSNGALGADCIFTYDRAGLELMLDAKREGIKTVMEQTVAPASLYLSLLHREFGDVPRDVEKGWKMLAEREEHEWELADKILCGSDFVRDSLLNLGVSEQKVLTVPYGVSHEQFTLRARGLETDRAIRALFVGEVGFRKGAKHLIEAANICGTDIEVALVGKVSEGFIDVTNLPYNVRAIGIVPRSEVRKWYDWADVFILPSLFEGSATVSYEAMASGLPVICTPETGSLVQDGVNGRIVDAGSTESLANALSELCWGQIAKWSECVVSGDARWSSISYSERFLSAMEQRFS